MKDCEELVQHPIIKISDSGMKANFSNAGRELVIKTKFDGCVVSQDTAADWILSITEVGDLVVELKGRGIEHAAKQINATAMYLLENDLRRGKVNGLIVCGSYPRGAQTSMQKAQLNFRRKHQGILRVSSNKRMFDLREMLR